jgi:hypothetical protein
MYLFVCFYVAQKNRTSFKTNINRNKNLIVTLIGQEQKEPSVMH